MVEYDILGVHITTFKPRDFSSDARLVMVRDHLGQDNQNGFECIYNLATAIPQAQFIVEYATLDPQGDLFDNVTAMPFYWFEARQELINSDVDQCPAFKSSAFSFMINKPRKNRLLLLDLLSECNLSTRTYSSAYPDHPHFEKKIYITEGMQQLESSVLNGSTTNSAVYRDYLKDEVFYPSVVHLITEPTWETKATFITEKTLFAFNSHNIPIWVGGWNHAGWFAEQGFDVFDDIVDHSYSTLDDHKQRAAQAIKLNYDLLNDADSLLNFYNNNRSRFEHNRRLARSNFLEQKYAKMLEEIVENAPDYINLDYAKSRLFLKNINR